MGRSHIVCTSCFWPFTIQKKNATLEKLEYRTVRPTTGAMIKTSGDKMYEDLGQETVKTRILFLSLCLLRKNHTNATRPLIRSCFPRKNLQNQVRTRQDKLINSYYYADFIQNEVFFQNYFFSKNDQTLGQNVI